MDLFLEHSNSKEKNCGVWCLLARICSGSILHEKLLGSAMLILKYLQIICAWPLNSMVLIFLKNLPNNNLFEFGAYWQFLSVQCPTATSGNTISFANFRIVRVWDIPQKLILEFCDFWWSICLAVFYLHNFWEMTNYLEHLSMRGYQASA